MFYVYVIKSHKTGEFYKGFTDNLERRLHQHSLGNSTFSKNKLPIELIHAELCNSRKEARKLEKYLKSGFGREIIKELSEKKD
ncbi:GIY-YIG nuclease family protein [Candidatus Daviesbacteria bacterium]|nr:GIY-YIG nuclease family protein [Candidatus Daviesbacteria bacterium]